MFVTVGEVARLVRNTDFGATSTSPFTGYGGGGQNRCGSGLVTSENPSMRSPPSLMTPSCLSSRK